MTIRATSLVLAVVGVVGWSAPARGAAAATLPRFAAPAFTRVPDPIVTNVVAADFDGDGSPDLAAANDDTLWVLSARGDGTFRRPVAYRDAGADGSLLATDLNGDGRPDLIANGMQSTDRFVVWLNDGAGHFRHDRSYRGSAQTEFAVADVNGDGLPDLLITPQPVRTSLLVRLGTGAGRFGPIRSLAGRYADYIAAGDVNGDGRVDVALARSARIAIRLGNGDGTFGPERAFRAADDTGRPLLVDVDRDGKLDLAAPRWEGAAVAVLLGRGDGTFGPQTLYGMGSEQSRVAVADFDGDGNLDMLTGSYAEGGPSSRYTRGWVRTGNGDGTFARAGAVPSLDSVGAPVVVEDDPAVADFDRDGRLDLASTAGDRDGFGVAVLLNWTGRPAPPCVVPPVRRVRLAPARRYIARAGCRVGRVLYRESRKVRRRHVISQHPGYGAMQPTGAPVDLVVSRGRRREPGPNPQRGGAAFGTSSSVPRSVAGVRHITSASSPLSW